MDIHRKDWANRLLEAVWAYRTTWKTTTRFTPFELVYGKKTLFPIEVEIKIHRTPTKLGLQLLDAQKERIDNLHALDECKLQAL